DKKDWVSLRMPRFPENEFSCFPLTQNRVLFFEQKCNKTLLERVNYYLANSSQQRSFSLKVILFKDLKIYIYFSIY
ncbi:hypothetical protein, partial [Escherichia coli]